MWRRSFEPYFQHFYCCDFKNNNKIFLTHIFLTLLLTMTSSSDEDYVKNKDYHAIEEGKSSFVKKIRPKGEIC